MVSPVAGLTLTRTHPIGPFTAYTATERAQPVVFRARGVTIPSVDTAYLLLEMGATGAGMGVWYQTGMIRARCGSGGGSTSNTDHAFAETAVTKGSVQDITVEFDPANRRLRMWLGEALVGNATSSQAFAEWAGGDAAGYGSTTSSTPTGVPTTSWPSPLPNALEAYVNQRSTWTEGGAAAPAIAPVGLSILPVVGALAVSVAAALSPVGMSSGPSLTAPSLTTATTAAPVALSATPATARPALTTATGLAPVGLSAQPAVATLDTGNSVSVAPVGLSVATSLGTANLTTSTSIAPTSLSAGPRVGSAAIAVGGAILPVGAAVAPFVGQPSITAAAALQPVGSTAQPTVLGPSLDAASAPALRPDVSITAGRIGAFTINGPASTGQKGPASVNIESKRKDEEVVVDLYLVTPSGQAEANPASLAVSMVISDTAGGAPLGGVKFDFALLDAATARYQRTLSPADLAALDEGKTYHYNVWSREAPRPPVFRASGEIKLLPSISLPA